MSNERTYIVVSVVALALVMLTSSGCQNTGSPMSPSASTASTLSATADTPVLEARGTVLDTINAGLVPNPNGGPPIFNPGVKVTPTPAKRQPRTVPGKPPKTIPGKKPVQK